MDETAGVSTPTMPAPRSPTTELCRELLRRPSLTPADHGCQGIVGDRLAAAGFDLEPMRFRDVENLWATLRSAGPLFVFAGHTDVVPTGGLDGWTHDPFSGHIDGDIIYGRGAADMKGAIAAMVTAVERYLALYQPAGSIAFLLTSDEEGPATHGTRQVVETLKARGISLDWCLVGEATSQHTFGDTIKNGRRGSMSGKLTVNGKQGHIAYPQNAENPVHAALAALDELVELEWDGGNDYFPATSFQISNIHAGTGAGNVIHGHMVVDFNLRFSPELSAEEIQRRLATVLERHSMDYDLAWTISGHPFLTEPGSLTAATAAAIGTVCGVDAELDTGGGTSDGRFIAPMGAQVIEFGPLNATIHQVNECVSVSDLDQLSMVYQRVLETLLGTAPAT